MTSKQKATIVIEKLKELYPKAPCSLDYQGSVWKLLIMAMLSAQCKDERVNQVSVGLFEKFPSIRAFADANPEQLELINGIPANYEKIVSGKATAYSAKPGALTASGRYAVVGTVAVNPNVIPYGSEVYVVAQDGSRVYGYAIAADTGYGMMDGSIAVDVFMGSYEDSCKWGAVYVDIYVLSIGDNRYISQWER